MSDDDFGDDDEIIVVHGRPLHSVEDATFKWYTDGERVFPIGRSKKDLLFPDEITFDRRISMGAGGLLMRLLAHDGEHIDVDDLVRESQARTMRMIRATCWPSWSAWASRPRHQREPDP